VSVFVSATGRSQTSEPFDPSLALSKSQVGRAQAAEVHAFLRHKLSIAFADVGEQVVKNMSHTVGVFRSRRSRSPNPWRRSPAVSKKACFFECFSLPGDWR
jgi:hypothetical protein